MYIHTEVLFSTIDYVLFYGMLSISVIIGVYYGCYRHQNTVDSYIFGDKKMKAFPVAMSLVASNISGISILAVPADIYFFGAHYIWMLIAIILSAVIGYTVFLPVFVKFQITSIYEYLSMRFDKRTCILASLLFTLSMFLYNPIVIYVPVLAFSQATGISIYVISPIVCLICIFYTTVGGLKAVVLTDALQTLSILVAVVIVSIMGIDYAGGLSSVLEISRKGKRLDIFNFDADPTIRDNFWTFAIGSTVNWCEMFAINQATIQRLKSVPSLKKAKQTVTMYCIGVLIINSWVVLMGLIIYSKYWNCDPFLAKKIERHDQLVPYYVIDVAGRIPGMSGLFIAGIFSAGLSTLSTTLNTLSATIYQDFINPFMPLDITEKKINLIMKLVVVILGIFSTLIVFIVQHLGGILPLTVRLKGVAGGALIGLFVSGTLLPKINAKGAFFGAILSLLSTSTLVFMKQWYKTSGRLKDFPKPLSIEGCNDIGNISRTINNFYPETDPPFVLFRISDWYFLTFGALATIIIASIVSFFTNEKSDPPVHPDLLSPVIYRFLSEKQQQTKQQVYISVDKKQHSAEKLLKTHYIEE